MLAAWLGQLSVLAQGNGAPGQGGMLNVLISLTPFLVIFLLFYVLLIRPEQKKRAALNAMLQALKKNDRVVTIGGIYGTVVNPSSGEDTVVIRVDDNNNTRIRVSRSAIARVLNQEAESEGARQVEGKAGARS